MYPSVRFSQLFGLLLVQTVSITSQLPVSLIGSYHDDASTVYTPVLYTKVGSIKHNIHSTNWTQPRFVQDNLAKTTYKCKVQYRGNTIGVLTLYSQVTDIRALYDHDLLVSPSR